MNLSKLWICIALLAKKQFQLNKRLIQESACVKRDLIYTKMVDRFKFQARELHQWKTEESRKVEALKQAEGAALELAEMEKAKCKAAMEAAEESQRIAELEAKKRLDAELKATHEEEEKKKALDALAQNDVRYRKYTIDEIETATQKFSENLKIGEGGYGPVYKATLDHTPVAIKVLRPDAAQGRKQFQQEVRKE